MLTGCPRQLVREKHSLEFLRSESKCEEIIAIQQLNEKVALNKLQLWEVNGVQTVAAASDVFGSS